MKERTNFSRKQLMMIGVLVVLLLALIIIPWRMAAGHAMISLSLNRIEVSPDGKHIAAAYRWQYSGEDSRAIANSLYTVYNLETGNAEQQLSMKRTPWLAWLACFTPDSRYIPIRTGFHWERLDIKTGQRTKLNVKDSFMKMARDGAGYWVELDHRVVTKQSSSKILKDITLLDLATGTVLRRLPPLAGIIRGQSDDGSKVVTAHYDDMGQGFLQGYHCYDARSGRELSSFSEGKGRISYALFMTMNQDGSRFATLSQNDRRQDQKITVWDTRTGQVIKAINIFGDDFTSISLNPAGTLLAGNKCNLKRVLLWQVDNGAILHTLPININADQCEGKVAFTADGRRLILAGTPRFSLPTGLSANDRLIKVWDVQSGALLKTIEVGGGNSDG